MLSDFGCVSASVGLSRYVDAHFPFADRIFILVALYVLVE